MLEINEMLSSLMLPSQTHLANTAYFERKGIIQTSNIWPDIFNQMFPFFFCKKVANFQAGEEPTAIINIWRERDPRLLSLYC